MALEGAKTGVSGFALASQNHPQSPKEDGEPLEGSLAPQGEVSIISSGVIPRPFVPSSTLLSSLWKVGRVEVSQIMDGDSSTTQTPSFSDGNLQPLEKEIECLRKERGEIKDADLIPTLDARISRLEKAYQILKGLEVSPIFSAQVVHQILESKGEESKPLDEILQTLQAYKNSRIKVNGLILQIVQEYPPRSPLIFELDLSDQNPKVKSYDPGGTSNREQMSAVDQPPLKTLREFSIIQAYQAVWSRSEGEAANLREKFAYLRDGAETFPFGINSLQAVERETERLEKLADPAISQFLTQVSDKRTERLKEDSSYQDRLAFQETLGALPFYAMIQAGVASASSDLEVTSEMLTTFRSEWKTELEAQKNYLESQIQRFTGNNLVIDAKAWEKSSLKPMVDRINTRVAEMNRQLQALNPSQSYTSDGLRSVLVQETSARVKFQESYLRTLLEIKQYQVAQIPSSVEEDQLVQIGSDLGQLGNAHIPLETGLQQYAKYSEELDHIALGRSIDTKLKMLEAGEGVVAIKDRAMNWFMNAPHEYIARKRLGDLANEASHLRAAVFHYQGVQRLYKEGKFEEASKKFTIL